MRYQRGTGGNYVEKPAAPRDTRTNFRLASHLVRVPNSGSGGQEFESLVWREAGALIKRKILGVRSSYNIHALYFISPVVPSSICCVQEAVNGRTYFEVIQTLDSWIKVTALK